MLLLLSAGLMAIVVGVVVFVVHFMLRRKFHLCPLPKHLRGRRNKPHRISSKIGVRVCVCVLFYAFLRFGRPESAGAGAIAIAFALISIAVHIVMCRVLVSR